MVGLVQMPDVAKCRVFFYVCNVKWRSGSVFVGESNKRKVNGSIPFFTSCPLR